MSASIEENFPGTWTLSIADLTSDNSASGLVSYDGPGSSAEWIEEDPDVNGQQATLSNFGTAEFTNLGASGVNPGDSSFEPVDMVDGSGNILAYPGSLVNDSFTITYVVPLKILTTSIPAATDNSPGFYQSLAASRGIAPYQWSVYSSSLP